MKKIITSLFTKVAMVACLATAMAGSAWAADETITININSFTDLPSGNATYSTYNWSEGGIDGKATIYANSNSTSMQFNASNYLFYSTSAISGKIKSIKLTTASGTNRTYVVYGSTTAYSGSGTSYGTQIGSQTVTTSGTTYTVSSGDYNYFTIVKSGSGAGYLASVEVTYTPSSGPAAVATTTTISDSGITNTDVYTGTSAGSLSATVKDANNNTISTAVIAWSGDNDDVATINASTGVVTLVGVGTVNFTATYAGVSSEYLGSYDTYEMTVTSSAPYVQPTEISITPNYSFWDKSAQFSGSTYDSLSGSKDNVSLDWSRGSGSTYANTTAMRFYKDNELTFTAPTDYEIKSIVLSVSDTYSDLAFSPNGWNETTKTWTGSAETVTMSRPSNASSYATISKFTITIGAPSTDPVISADNVNIAYNATGGSIAFTVDNPVDGGVVSASTEADWITPGSAVSASPIAFNCTANSETTPRSATVTLTYTYNTNETVTKNVTVTQAAAPVIYSTIPALFNVATSTETNVTIAFGGWVVSAVHNKNAYLTDNQGHGLIIYADSHGFQVNDVLTGTVSCGLQLYRGSAELTNLTTSSNGLTVAHNGTVTAQNIAISNLGGVNTGALLAFEGLSYDGTNLVDGDNNTITPYTTLYSGTFTSGKSYNVSGIYLQFNDTKELLPRSAADIQEIVPIIPTVTPATTSINVVAAGENGTLAVTYDNITDVAADVAFYQSNGTTTATYDWITASVNNENNVVYQVAANTSSEPRSAYMKVWALDDNLNEVYSDLITITQAGFVADYATLPFNFDGGRADIENKAGLTQSDLGTDYSSSPKLKFDSANDCVILKINEAPGVLSFDIKGNPSSGSWSGTFKVQGSSDGVTYTDIKTYSSISTSKQSEAIDQLESNVRYIKWILVTKDNGNVALGKISLAKVDLTPSITVSSNTINAPATETQGTLDVTYKNIETSTGVEVSWFESDGTTPSTEPAWIDVDVNSSFNVDYLIEANTGAARTAYFKVYGLDSEANGVYSELVTVSQEEYIPNYATLPFEWDDTSTPQGITNSGVDTYSSSPHLKFDNTGDYIILEFNETPGTLTFDIKGNGFSGGTFKVQTSTDGESFTDLETYTSLTDTQSEEFDLLPNVRYVKWVYVEKVSGNVGLGNIKLTAMADADSYIIEGAPNNGQYWASFYCNAAGYTISEGAKAFTMNASKQLYLLGDGNVIPANTAVIIISDTDTITLTKTDNASATVYGGANILVGSDSDTVASGITGTPYVLSIVNNALGFYKFTGTIPANKAYYIVNE